MSTQILDSSFSNACQISIIKPNVLLFDCDGIVEPIDSLLKFLQPKNHDLHHNNLVNLGLTNNTK